jgi:hypothetical protein
MIESCTSEIKPIEQVACKVLDCEPEELREEKYDHYGLKIFSCHGLEYAIGSDVEAQKAVSEYIKQSLWAFNASFILCHSKTGYNPELENCLKQMQGKLCESANSLVEALIEDLDEFIEDAIGADGRGHFLSSYDGNEEEIKVNNEYYYGYRLN